MNFPLKSRISWRIVFSAVILLVSLSILYISLVRASLEIMTHDNNENILRVKPIVFNIYKNDKPDTYVYKFPEVTTTPANPIYEVKELRDNMWIYLSHEPISKTKMILLIADKKITECQMLYKQNKYNLALDTGVDAFNKLKYANEVISEVKPNNIEAKLLKDQIYKAGYAYREAFISIDRVRFQQLIKDLDKWNEEKQQKNLDF